MSPQALRIRCRQIARADLDGIADLLTRGFISDNRTRDFWVCGLRRLSEHPTPPGFPKYGYLLECNGTPIGVVILIFSSLVINGETRIRCSLSSMYVEPEFRGYGGILHTQACKHAHVTYFNITPGPQLWPILEAHGFTVYCSGRFVAVPVLDSCWERARVKPVTADICIDEDLQPPEIELLLLHAKYGCISVTCSAANRRYPFVFVPGRGRHHVPRAYLAYCRDQEDFVRFAGPLGRFLARRGFPAVILDSNGPIKGLIGKYQGGRKYFKGPDKPRLGDLAYSERVIFNF